MTYHTTKDGDEIPLNKLSDRHLINIIKLIERRARQGITVFAGGGDSPDDFWYDEERLKGLDALEEMNYFDYMDEYNRRGLIPAAGLKNE